MYLAGSNTGFDEARKLSFVGLLVILLQIGHVVSNMFAHDVVTMYRGIELAAFSIIPWETAGAEE